MVTGTHFPQEKGKKNQGSQKHSSRKKVVKKAQSAMNYVKDLMGDREIGLDINQIMGESIDNEEEMMKQ